MKKKILCVIAALLLLLISGCAFFETDSGLQKQLDQKNKYLNAINDITTEFMSSNVMVKASFGTGLISEGQQGSGVIFKKTTDLLSGSATYYVLTNHHVVTKKSGSTHIKAKSYELVDYKDVKFFAEYVFADIKYDLAVLKFTVASPLLGEDSTSYYVCGFSASNPTVGEGVFAVGQPLGQRNSITFGYVTGYYGSSEEEKKLFDWCEVDFDCVVHTAYINSGNSGGVLLNADIKICGINFAGGKETVNDVDTDISLSIPVQKVKECLAANGIFA